MTIEASFQAPHSDGDSYDVVVIGGGQAGLACGYYLRRSDLSFVILDAESCPGGAWRHAWDSLRLFSPAAFSSLPGWPMPGGPDLYPPRDQVLDYLAKYEQRYNLPVHRPVLVAAVRSAGSLLQVETDAGLYRSRAVVSATGTLRRPYIPDYPGRDLFQGLEIHSSAYRRPEPFAGKRVLIVGGGNSGAQILAEISLVAEARWVTLDPPRFLPDDVDGRVLFDQATAQYRALQSGENPQPSHDLSSIVMVPPVRQARERGVLSSVRPFERFGVDGVVWQDGSTTPVDVVIWCTGFRPVLEHLGPLGVLEDDGRVAVSGQRSLREPRLWLVGYGNWTGFASATLIAVGRSARSAVQEIRSSLSRQL